MKEQKLEGQDLSALEDAHKLLYAPITYERKKLGLVSGLAARTAILFSAASYAACGGISEDGDSQTPTPFVTQENVERQIERFTTPTLTPTQTSEPTPTPVSTPTPELSPTPVPTPTPEQTLLASPPPEVEFEEGFGYPVDDDIVVRACPSSTCQKVETLKFGEEVQILDSVKGEMWLNRNQGISPFGSFPEWVEDWYELENGGYVYSAFIFIPKEDESSPFASGEKRVEVDRDDQILHAYVDDKEVFQAPVGVGLPGMETPLGNYNVRNKILNETMSGPGYHVQSVLFTMYFTSVGHAIHLDWWHGDSYFGNEPTSHGCVGLQLHNAQWIWFFGFPGMKVNIYE